jgi:flavin reductase (DIM6/NTAB) family NADH-FMN oxidoreductase RutF
MTSGSSREESGAALALVPSGCSILTCAADGESTGMLASWVQQAAFEPPMVTVAVKRGRPIVELIERRGRFTLNLLGEHPFKLLKHFARGFAPEEPAFADLETEVTDYGVELAEAAGVLACRVVSRAEAGDHHVYVAEVVSGRVLSTSKPYVHVRKSGFAY